MFRRNKHHNRRRRGGFGILRIFMSLIMISILSLGVISAYRSFSGIDPFKASPQATLRSLLSSEGMVNTLAGLLAFSPSKVLTPNKKEPPSDNNPTLGVEKSQESTPPKPKPTNPPAAKLDFKFAVVADSENDNDDLKKALSQAKSSGAAFVIGLGDYTEVGTVDELKKAKDVFDLSALEYHLIPGDHDLWDSRNRGLSPTADFNNVFGQDYQSFKYKSTLLLLINNSDNYKGVYPGEMSWLETVLSSNQSNSPQLKLVFTSTPLYHPSSDHVMGAVEPSLKKQATDLEYTLKKGGVKEILAGDTHFFSQYTEPKNDFKMTAAGAITQARNLQSPRYLIVDVYTDGSYNIEDTEIRTP